MKTFKDNKDREWRIEINVTAVKRVKSIMKVDLLTVIDGQLVESLSGGDPILLCDVIWILVMDQAAGMSPPVTDDEFGKGMSGDSLIAAWEALSEELVNFSPRPRDRANRKKGLTKMAQAIERGQTIVGARLDGLDVNKLVDQALSDAGVSSGSAPA